MSCVAEASAMRPSKPMESLKNPVLGMANATNASPAEMRNCIATTHHRFVRVMSTKGLHSGFTTHGKYNKLV